jgi:hypothetical protein
MVGIILTNGYFIEKEGRDHVLKQNYMAKGKNKQEHEAVRNVGYFSSTENAIRCYLEEMQTTELDGLQMSMKEYANAIQVANDGAVKQILEQIGE